MSVVWEGMGFIRWPLAFSLVSVILLAAFSAARLFRPGAVPDFSTKTWVDAILFWGGFSVISGVLGTLIGIIIAAEAVEFAGDVSTSLLWGGIKVSMLSSAFGTLILAFAALLWFVLQLRWRLLLAEGADTHA